MGFWTRLFGSGWKERDRERQRPEDRLSSASPKAAVGAEIAAEKDHSETEEVLRRATDGQRRPTRG